MPLWNNTDVVGSAPTFPVSAKGTTSAVAYANTSSNPELYGVDTTEARLARTGGKGSVSPGWVTVTKVGTRKRYETLAVVKGMSGDGADDVTFPDV